MPLGDGYLGLMRLLVFDAFPVARLEDLFAGDWECASRFLALSFRVEVRVICWIWNWYFARLNPIIFG